MASRPPHQALGPRDWAAPTPDRLAHRLSEICLEHPRSLHPETLGHSRLGNPIIGMRLGRGPLAVSITAGAHADEPAGPLAALELASVLLKKRRDLLGAASFRICPHVNPDGALRNVAWFRPAEPDMLIYAREAHRDLPGEDIEFAYPRDPDDTTHPENMAVASFLADGAPYALHLSLHGMSFGEGAWWLIGADSVDRTAPLRPELAHLFKQRGFGLHDSDRRGDKGFQRIEPGFATTPTSHAMRQHFIAKGDAATAALFRPSSMELIQSFGGNPMVMVSELPLFCLRTIGARPAHPSLGTAHDRFRERYAVEVEAFRQTSDGTALEALASEFHVRPVPWTHHVQTLVEAIIMALDFMVGESDA